MYVCSTAKKTLYLYNVSTITFFSWWRQPVCAADRLAGGADLNGWRWQPGGRATCRVSFRCRSIAHRADQYLILNYAPRPASAACASQSLILIPLALQNMALCFPHRRYIDMEIFAALATGSRANCAHHIICGLFCISNRIRWKSRVLPRCAHAFCIFSRVSSQPV